jgi:hypothetical protein
LLSHKKNPGPFLVEAFQHLSLIYSNFSFCYVNYKEFKILSTNSLRVPSILQFESGELKHIFSNVNSETDLIFTLSQINRSRSHLYQDKDKALGCLGYLPISIIHTNRENAYSLFEQVDKDLVPIQMCLGTQSVLESLGGKSGNCCLSKNRS